MNGIYLLLGSNVGNRLDYLRAAEDLLIKDNIIIIDESSVYETAPWGVSQQGWFLNVAIQVDTSLRPDELLTNIQAIENKIGRIRKERWGERIIDIDLLYYHDEIISTEFLNVPHTGIPARKFTLVLLAEMCPLEIHPISKKTQMELLADCEDTLDCRLTDYKL